MKAYDVGFFAGVAAKEKDMYNCQTALQNNHYPVMSKDWLEFNSGWKDAY